ncbi:MAG: FKBP-type peptidyl-prolyl cis-trans isomerase [Candidatus Symbiothrix sp.]|jgi:FKBP-type peptidyl-prolyl cis-trans isomerase SlyD|nr:FKBP-type peptidyl-prolyl cis-trans isomerase [Candidatus Symbiothrix sp.]
MKITKNAIVSLGYKLFVEDEDAKKELMEETTPDHPLTFMYDVGMMLEAFEKQLDGLKKGDKFAFKLAPKEAYGEFIDENVIELPKKLFEIDGKFDATQVVEGATLPMMDDQGNRLQGSVMEVKPDVVVMDFNHPLAGETLEFEGEILDVHEPTPEEIAALTGQGGGCSCGDDCDCTEEDNCGCK